MENWSKMEWFNLPDNTGREIEYDSTEEESLIWITPQVLFSLINLPFLIEILKFRKRYLEIQMKHSLLILYEVLHGLVAMIVNVNM